MKKLNITKEQFNKSIYLKNKYGNLKFVSESSTGRLFKTDKGRILKFVAEARELIDDSSIETDTADEFIIFDDPTILDKIANVQKKQCEEIQDEVKDGDVKPQEVANAAKDAADKAPSSNNAAAVAGAVGSIGSAAITTAGNIATSKAALGLAAAAGYKAILDKAGEVGEELGGKVGDAYSNWKYGDEMAALDEKIAMLKKVSMQNKQEFLDYAKISNLGKDTSQGALQNDKRAMYIAKQLKSGETILGSRNREVSPEDAKKWLVDHGYEINKDGIVNKVTNIAGAGAAGAATAGASAAGAAGAAGAGTAATGAGAAGAGAAGAEAAGAGATAATGGATGWSLFGMSAATVGWIVAGVAAAAVITPYIYDKVRACTKTWMADIIAEVKFKADGKNYRCFYDLKKNKWVLTYADIKWTSYLDNKLDKETKDEFFASSFFQEFLGKCRKAFAMLFSTSRNEVVFKTLPELKDAPKELKSILEKIYDNKGAISKNMFTGNHD